MKIIKMGDHLPPRHCMIVFNQYPLGETRVQREAEALVRSGFKVDVICKCEPLEASVDTYKGVGIYREKYQLRLPLIKKESLLQKFIEYFRFFISAFLRLNYLHSKYAYASIQIHNIPDFLVFSAILQKIKRIPIILDLHDLMPEFYAGRFGQNDALVLRIIRLQEQLACNFADHIITVSEHWRNALISRGIPASKCSVIMNVADQHIFHPQLIVPLRNPIDNGFRLIYHGTMVRRYGLDLAIDAVAKLLNQIPGIQLFLIGQGEFLSELYKLVEQNKLHDYITFKPKQQAEGLPKIILSCDLGIVPYRNDVFTDGLLPTKLMEYTALGLPAVASRTTTIESYFSGANVEFFEPGNSDDLARCILYLYRDPVKISELRQRCRNFNDRYNWDMVSIEYINLVHRLQAKGNKDFSPVKFIPNDKSSN